MQPIARVFARNLKKTRYKNHTLWISQILLAEAAGGAPKGAVGLQLTSFYKYEAPSSPSLLTSLTFVVYMS